LRREVLRGRKRPAFVEQVGQCAVLSFGLAHSGEPPWLMGRLLLCEPQCDLGHGNSASIRCSIRIWKCVLRLTCCTVELRRGVWRKSQSTPTGVDAPDGSVGCRE